MQTDAGFRLFGFLSDQQRLSQWEQDWLTATFGLDEICVPAHGYQEVMPQVVWAPFHWHHRNAGQVDDSPAALKRSLIWKHHARNRFISKLAKTLHAGETSAIAEYVPDSCDALAGDQPRQVILLVDGVEQALAIAPRLPKWPIVTGNNINQRYLTGKQRRVVAARGSMWQDGSHLIVTAAGAENIDIAANAQSVVIWASSGGHLPPLPPAWRIVPASEARNLLIVDIDDRGKSLLAEWKRQRKKAYQRAEWS